MIRICNFCGTAKTRLWHTTLPSAFYSNLNGRLAENFALCHTCYLDIWRPMFKALKNPKMAEKFRKAIRKR